MRGEDKAFGNEYKQQFLIVPSFTKVGLGEIRMIPLSQNIFGLRYR
jgi:hypothetical protein